VRQRKTTPVEELLFILQGVPTTIEISILSFLLGFAIGLPLAFVRVYAIKPLQILADGYEKVLRGVPELVIMFFLYFGVGPAFGLSVLNDPFSAATIALGLRSGANQSQIFRGAIRGVGEEQTVAARSLGLSKLQAITYVIIPQTFIMATPSLGSEYALLVKGSSFAFILGVLETMKMTDIVRRTTYDMVYPYFIGAFIYIMLTFPLATYLDMWGSRKKKQLGL
jgi:polar amino acid transport system permease protein